MKHAEKKQVGVVGLGGGGLQIYLNSLVEMKTGKTCHGLKDGRLEGRGEDKRMNRLKSNCGHIFGPDTSSNGPCEPLSSVCV